CRVPQVRFFTWVLGSLPVAQSLPTVFSGFSSLPSANSVSSVNSALVLLLYRGITPGCPRFDFLPKSWVPLLCELSVLCELCVHPSFRLLRHARSYLRVLHPSRFSAKGGLLRSNSTNLRLFLFSVPSVFFPL